MLRLRQQTRSIIVVLLIMNAMACSLSRRMQIAHLNNRLATAGVEMKEFVQKEYDAKRMPVDEYEEWKTALGKAGKYGRLLTDALIAGNDDVAAVQVDAFLDLLDELQRENVAKLNPTQQAIAYVVLSSIRTTLDILVVTVM